MRTPIHPHSLSGTYSMTEPFTERFHRRGNWPPGFCHPPDRGRTLTANLHPPEHPHWRGISGRSQFEFNSNPETSSMTDLFTVRFYRLGDWSLCDSKSLDLKQAQAMRFNERLLFFNLSLIHTTRLPLAQFFKQWDKRQEVACFKTQSRRTTYHATTHKY